MAMHLNGLGLSQNGFKLVASYKCFSKGERMLNIDCYSDGACYLVRNFLSGGRAWDNVYSDKDKANARVKELMSIRKWHKRVF